MEADISGFCQCEKKNWSPIFAIVWPIYDYKELAKDTGGLFARIVGRFQLIVTDRPENLSLKYKKREGSYHLIWTLSLWEN